MAEVDGKIRIGVDLEPLDRAQIDKISNNLLRRLNEVNKLIEEFKNNFAGKINTNNLDDATNAASLLIREFRVLDNALGMVNDAAGNKTTNTFNTLNNKFNETSKVVEGMQGVFQNALGSDALYDTKILDNAFGAADLDKFARKIELGLNDAINNTVVTPSIRVDPQYDFSTDELLRKLDEDIASGVAPTFSANLDLGSSLASADALDNAILDVDEAIRDSVDETNIFNTSLVSSVGSTSKLSAAFTVVHEIADKLSKPISSLISGVSKVVDTTKKLISSFKKVVSGIVNATKKVIDFTRNLSNALGVSKQIKQTLDTIGLGDLINANIISDLIKKLTGSLKELFSDSLEDTTKFNEAALRINNTFGDMSDAIFDASSKATGYLGISEREYLNTASQIGVALRDSIRDTEKLASVTNGLSYAAADVAAAWGDAAGGVDNVSKQFMSAIEGSGKALKNYGIVMTDTYVEAYAQANGLTSSFNDLDDATKRLYRSQYLIDQLQRSGYMGMAAKLANTWSGQVGLLHANLENLRVTLGQILQKLLLPILTVINTILGRVVDMANVLAKSLGISKYTTYLETPAGDTGYSSYYDNAAKSIDGVSDAQNKLAKNTKKASEAAKKSLAPFHKLNVLQRKSNSDKGSDAGAGGVGGAGGLGSGLSSVLGAGSKVKDTAKSWASNWIEELKKAFKAGNFEQVGALLANAFTKMLKSIDNFIKKAEKKLRKASKTLARILNGFVGEMFKKVEGTDESGWHLLGKTIGDGINLVTHTIMDFVDNTDFVALGAGLGESFRGILDSVDFESLGRLFSIKSKILLDLARGFVLDMNKVVDDFSGWQDLGFSLADFFNGFFDLPWEDAGDTAAQFINGISDTLISFNEGFQFSDVTKRIAEGINNFLDELNPEKISKGFVGLFNNLVKGLWTLITGINWIRLGQRVGQLIADALMEFDWGTAIDGLVRLLVGLLAGSISALVSFGFTIGEKLGGKIYDGLHDFVETVFDFGEVLGSKLADAVSAVTKFASKVKSKILSIGSNISKNISSSWNTLVTSVTTFFTNMFNSAKSLVSSAVTTITNLFKSLKNKIIAKVTDIKTSVVNKFTAIKNGITKVISDAKTKIVGIFSSIKSSIVTAAGNIKSGVLSAFRTLKSNAVSTFNNMKSSIVGVFKSIVSAVKAPVNSLLRLIEKMLNGAIDGINAAAKLANKISFDMPDALGGGHVGFDIPTLDHVKLPKLAKGAVIQPNHEFAAILGDQRQGVNIETPLQTMINAFESSLENMGVSGGDITIPVYIGQQLIDEIVVNANRKANYRSNGR